MRILRQFNLIRLKKWSFFLRLTLLQRKNEVLGKQKWYLLNKKTEPVTERQFNNAEVRAQPRGRHKMRTIHFAFMRTFSISDRYDSCKLQYCYTIMTLKWQLDFKNSIQTGCLCKISVQSNRARQRLNRLLWSVNLILAKGSPQSLYSSLSPINLSEVEP